MTAEKYIIDSSALLALMFEELGQEVVSSYIKNCTMSSVNVSESISLLLKRGAALNTAEKDIFSLISEEISFDHEQAVLAASLREKTNNLGLSFGDRACIALGIITKRPILTADRIWSKLDIGAKIIVVR